MSKRQIDKKHHNPVQGILNSHVERDKILQRSTTKKF
jgi:hypothetical protein